MENVYHHVWSSLEKILWYLMTAYFPCRRNFLTLSHNNLRIAIFSFEKSSYTQIVVSSVSFVKWRVFSKMYSLSLLLSNFVTIVRGPRIDLFLFWTLFSFSITTPSVTQIYSYNIWYSFFLSILPILVWWWGFRYLFCYAMIVLLVFPVKKQPPEVFCKKTCP